MTTLGQNHPLLKVKLTNALEQVELADQRTLEA